jgi:hypothetical protein
MVAGSQQVEPAGAGLVLKSPKKNRCLPDHSLSVPSRSLRTEEAKPGYKESDPITQRDKNLRNKAHAISGKSL